jgi:hypothetical protein
MNRIKKIIFLSLFLFQIMTVIYSDETSDTKKDNTDDLKIIYEAGKGHHLGYRYLKRDPDFLSVYSQIPEAKNIYIKSIKFRIAGFTLLGTSAATGLIGIIFFAIQDYYSGQDSINYPFSYKTNSNPKLALDFIIAGSSTLGLMGTELIVMFFSFIYSFKLKEDSIVLYNKKVQIGFKPFFFFNNKEKNNLGFLLSFNF